MILASAGRGGRGALFGVVLVATLSTLVAQVRAPHFAAAAVPPVAPPAPLGAEGVHQFGDPAQTFSFEGRGWGHGVGFCQWGARGRALAGQSAEEILAAYYPGTSIQKAIAPETAIRVLLHTGLQLAPGEAPRITASGGHWQVETSGASPVAGAPDAYLALSADGTGPRYSVKDKGGTATGEGALRGPLVLRPLDPGTRFTIGYKPAAAVAGRSGAYYDVYRGELILSPLGDGVETINRLSLEDYLRGVVPGEMPASWPAAALRAQALAARSYAVAQARARAGLRYDVDDTTRYQVYLGANAERPNVNQIVDATAGQVILWRGSAIQAYFFSTCAGWTENNESVWPSGEPLPYLRGIRDADPGGRAYDADAPLSTWSTGPVAAAQVEEALNSDPATEVGRLLSLDLSQRSPSGRLLWVRATGSSGSKTIQPETFMARFNRLRPPGAPQLRSANFDLQWIGTPPMAPAGAPEATAAVPTAAPPPIPPATPQSAQPTPAAATASGGVLPSQSAPQPAAPPAPQPASVPTPAHWLDATQPAPPRPASPTSYYFEPTGHNVGGAFLRFFDERGGLDIFGYPRTDEILDGGRTVQYFQRSALEFHTAHAGSPYEVQLALLGDTLTADRRPFPTVEPFDDTNEHVYFPETGHGLHYAFLDYWRTRGGLDTFGYPISEELEEVNDDGSGRAYTVQYFQRARFEYHPELPPEYHVSLGLLGDQLLLQRLWLR